MRAQDTFREEKDCVDNILRDLNLCECYHSDEACRSLLEILAAFEKDDDLNYLDPSKREQIESRLGSGCYTLLLYFLDQSELLEHGCSLSAPWLTSKGHDLIERLRKVELEEGDED